MLVLSNLFQWWQGPSIDPSQLSVNTSHVEAIHLEDCANLHTVVLTGVGIIRLWAIVCRISSYCILEERYSNRPSPTNIPLLQLLDNVPIRGGGLHPVLPFQYLVLRHHIKCFRNTKSYPWVRIRFQHAY